MRTSPPHPSFNSDSTATDRSRLRTSYPSEHGLVLFPDASIKTRSIPWCFPATNGFGVIAYNVNIPITDPGTLSLAPSDIRPATQFAAVSIDGTCAGNNTGKTFLRLGYGTQWSMAVEPGNYCLTLGKAANHAEGVWFTLTATRP